MTSMGIYYLTRLLVTLAAIPVHEAGHALASWLMGDPTARDHGRLSLNPPRHFALLGTICMVAAGAGAATPPPAPARDATSDNTRAPAAATRRLGPCSPRRSWRALPSSSTAGITLKGCSSPPACTAPRTTPWS